MAKKKASVSSNTLQLTVSDITILSGVYTLPTKTLLVGPNGSGKSSILNAIKIALKGTGLKGLRPDVLAPRSKKPYVSLTHNGEVIGQYPAGQWTSDWKVLDIHDIGSTGPERTAYLLELMGGTITADEIHNLLRTELNADVYEQICTFGDDPERIVSDINVKKRGSETDTKANMARIQVKTMRTVAQIEADIAKLHEQMHNPEMDAATAYNDLQELLAAYPKLANTDTTKAKAKLMRDIDSGNHTLTTINDRAEVLQNRLADCKLATVTDGVCPTCGTRIGREAVDAARELRKEIQDEMKGLSQKEQEWRAFVHKSSESLKLLEKFIDLKSRSRAASSTSVSLTALREKRNALEIERTSAQARDKQSLLETISAEWKLAEKLIKDHKTAKAESVKFPDKVADIVKGVLGVSDITFSTTGRTSEMCVVTDSGIRPITTLSAGEMAVVAAAFGAMIPNTIILVEAAEIDSDKLTKLMEHLLDIPEPVIIASWDASRKADGWTVLTPADAAAR